VHASRIRAQLVHLLQDIDRGRHSHSFNRSLTAVPVQLLSRKESTAVEVGRGANAA
jgi:hypothetical protein